MKQEKKKVQMKNYNLTKQNKRLKEKCDNLQKIVSKLKKKKYFTVDQFTELELKAVELTNRLVAKSKSKGYRQKYTPALRKFAVTLHYYSAAAYKYVRQVFNGSLPHPRVIGKWYENSSGDPGFSKQALDILEKKYKASGQRMLCTLIADEMALRHQTIWTGRKTAGVVDFGTGPQKSCEIATQAYVFIVVCMTENWKIPIAYFLVNGLAAETRASLLKTAISECHNVGVDIAAVTFDGCAANINAANILGCNLKNPFCLKTTFKHPECDREVAIILDACHMIKLVRNSFEAKRLIFDESGNQIRWQLLVNLVKLQKNIGLNFATKITPRHIHFRNEVMKVKLATQVLSMSVANALILCNELITSSMFNDTEGTVNFITIFNNLFDILNSRASDLYGLKKPLSAQNENEVLAYLEKAKHYILGLTIFIKYRRVFRKRITMQIVKKKIVESKNKTGFLGFLVCIESLKHLYATLIQQERRLRYIATYRLSQDHIEILFGVIRRHGGYNNNPNAIQFKGIFRKILQHLGIKSSFLGNCVPLENIPILTCSSAVQTINMTVDKRAYDNENVILESEKEYTESDHVINGNVEILSKFLNHENVKKTTDQIIGYISGWVSRKLCKALKCETCINRLFSNEKMWFHKMISQKNLGGLCFPSEDVFKICLRSESVLKNHLKEKGNIILPDLKDVEILKHRVLKSFINCPDLFQSLEVHSFEQPVHSNHQIHLIRAVIDKFINVRLHYAHKNNINSKEVYKRQKRNKLSLFEGI